MPDQFAKRPERHDDDASLIGGASLMFPVRRAFPRLGQDSPTLKCPHPVSAPRRPLDNAAGATGVTGEKRMQGLALRKHRAAAGKQRPRGDAEYQRGMAHAKNDRWEAAIEAFERAVARRPSDNVYWLNLAHARVRCGQFDRGAEAALRGASLAPESDLALAVAAECLNAANRHAETISLVAGRDLERIRDPQVHFQIGQAFQQLDRFKEAIDRYLAALSHKPDYMVAHVQLGNAFQRLKMHEEARECFKTAIAVGGDAFQLPSGMAYEDVHAWRWD